MSNKPKEQELTVHDEQLNQNVTQSNTLVQLQRADELLSSQEKNLVVLAISSIKPDQQELEPITFTVSEYLNLLNLTDGSENYKSVRDACKSIRDKSIWINSHESGKKHLFSWFQDVYIDEKETEITLILNKELEPFLLNQFSEFSSYKLGIMFALNSQYAKRLYEVLNSLKNLSSWEYSTEELKEILSVNNKKSYESFGNFKNRVLDPSVDEINKKTDIFATYTLRKKGKTYTHIKFELKRQALKGDFMSFDTKPKKYDVDIVEMFKSSYCLSEEIIVNGNITALLKYLCGWKKYNKSFSDAYDTELYSNIVYALVKMISSKRPMRFANIPTTSEDIIELINNRISIAAKDNNPDFYDNEGYLSSLVMQVMERYKKRIDKGGIKNHAYYLRGIIYNLLTEGSFIEIETKQKPSIKDTIFAKCPELRNSISLYLADKKDGDINWMKRSMRDCKQQLIEGGYDPEVLFTLFLVGEDDITED